MKAIAKGTPRVFRGMSPAFDSLSRDIDLWLGSLGRVWMPALDIYRKDEEMVIRLDLPGMEKEDVKVKVVDDVLILEGERKLEKEVDEESYLCREASHGTFTRRIALPNPVEEYEVKASLENGVLEVHVPIKEEAAQPKEIPVR